jgi:hypothetical protein
MTRVLIANMLAIVAEPNPADPKYIGVEFSPPVSMAGASVVAVAGTVKDVVRTSTNEQCLAEIQGSNDLMRWFPVASGTVLPGAPGSFAISGVAVSYAWVRVRWLLRAPDDAIHQGTMWVITAELNTNVG